MKNLNESNFLKKLKIVVVNNPCDHFEHEDVRSMFGKILSTKRLGYKKEYVEAALPMDTTDFFSTHLAICEEEDDGQLNPICTYKSVKYSDCKRFNVPFCPEAIIEEGGSEVCYKELQSIIENCESRGEEISYDCSWTVVPKYRKSEYSVLLRELAMAVGYWHHRDYKIPEWMTCGIIRMNTHKFFIQMGHNPISEDPYFGHPSLKGEKAMMVHLSEFSDWGRTTSEPFQGLWEERLEFGDRAEEVKKAA